MLDTRTLPTELPIQSSSGADSSVFFCLSRTQPCYAARASPTWGPKGAHVRPLHHVFGVSRIRRTFRRRGSEVIGHLKPGQCFKRSQIIDSIGNLHASGLFLSATPIIPNNTDQNGQVPIIFKVKERKMRNIKLGLNYSTDKDLRITGSLEWKHQNLIGNGENLTSTC